MGLTRSERFSAQQNELARLAKALGHPARIAILEYLLQADRCICGDIVEALPLAQATVSQHLRELKTAGLIKGNIEGVSVCYCIDHEAWQQQASLLQSFFEKKGPQENCCP
jgi:ArsR family transcriptional regulator